MAIQLFNEYDNYFSHMPRLCTNTCSGAQHQAAMEPSPRRPHAIIVDVLFIRRFTFSISCTFFALIFHCVFWERGGGGDGGGFIPAAPRRTSAPHSVPSPSTNPHPDPIRLIMVILSRGKCHYGNRGRGGGGLSVGERVRGGGGRRGVRVEETGKIEKDCEPSGAEESTSGHLTQV